MEKQSEWKNVSSGHQGVVKYNEDGKRLGLSVPPGETVLLTKKERVATANAPRREEDNPFANGAFQLVTPEADIENRRPIGDENAPTVEREEPEEPAGGETPTVQEGHAQEVGAAPEPGGLAPEGQAAPHEEVAEEDEKPEDQPQPPTPPTPVPKPTKK